MSDDDAQTVRELERVGVDLPPGLEVVWLGVSGYRLTYQGVSIFIDPYVSRVPLRAFVLRRRTLPDPTMVERYATAPGAVAGVLVGHTHFDHVVDAPALAWRYGAKAYGSSSLGHLLSARPRAGLRPPHRARGGAAGGGGGRARREGGGASARRRARITYYQLVI